MKPCNKLRHEAVEWPRAYRLEITKNMEHWTDQAIETLKNILQEHLKTKHTALKLSWAGYDLGNKHLKWLRPWCLEMTKLRNSVESATSVLHWCGLCNFLVRHLFVRDFSAAPSVASLEWMKKLIRCFRSSWNLSSELWRRKEKISGNKWLILYK